MDSWHMGSQSPDARQIDRRASWGEHNWGWMLALGVAVIVLGVVVVTHAFGSLSALVWLTGLFLIFMGATELLWAVRSEERGSRVAAGLIAVAGGIVLLAWPGETLKVLAFLTGITFLGWGLVSLLAAFRNRRAGRSELSDLVAGVGLVLLAILVMAWPAATVSIVGILVGLVAIAWGVVTAVGALGLRKAGRQFEEELELERKRARDKAA